MSDVTRLKDMQAALDICSGDCCVAAARRAYDGMRAAGMPEDAAFGAARHVLRWHHPEIGPGAADMVLRGWLAQGSAH